MLNGLFSNITMGFFKYKIDKNVYISLTPSASGFFNYLVNILWEKTLLSVHKPHDEIIIAVRFFKKFLHKSTRKFMTAE